MANVDRLQALIALLKTEDSNKRFHMDQFFHEQLDNEIKEPICGTASCIAGHAVLMRYPNALIDWAGGIYVGDKRIDNPTENPADIAQSFLEINDNEATWLFYGYFHRDGLNGNISIDMAIKAIEHIIEGKDVVTAIDDDNNLYSRYEYVILSGVV